MNQELCRSGDPDVTSGKSEDRSHPSYKDEVYPSRSSEYWLKVSIFTNLPSWEGFFMEKIQYFDRQPLTKINFAFAENQTNTDWLITEVAKAGFDVVGEYDRRKRLQEKFGREQGDMMWIGGITDEVTEHALEYSKKDIVRAPRAYTLTGNRLFSSQFDQLGVDLISDQERNGSVKRGFEKVEQLVALAGDNQLVLWSSPSGPFGVGDIEYDYSWTHVFWQEVKEGITSVRYVSIRNNFTLLEHAGFLNIFLDLDKQLNDQDFATDSNMASIQKILETPVLTSKDSGINSLPDIGRAMKLYMNAWGKSAYIDKQDGRKRGWEEVISDLQRIEEIQRAEREEIQPIINRYEQLIYLSHTKEEALRHMAEYVLMLNSFYRKFYRKGKNESNLTSYDLDQMTDRLRGGYGLTLLSDLKEVKGCAGGGNTVRQNTTNFTSRLSEKTFTGNCPVCRTQVRDLKVGELCPGCGTEYLCA